MSDNKPTPTIELADKQADRAMRNQREAIEDAAKPDEKSSRIPPEIQKEVGQVLKSSRALLDRLDRKKARRERMADAVARLGQLQERLAEMSEEFDDIKEQLAECVALISPRNDKPKPAKTVSPALRKARQGVETSIRKLRVALKDHDRETLSGSDASPKGTKTESVPSTT
jgi:chromosome segregation ATPase